MKKLVLSVCLLLSFFSFAQDATEVYLELEKDFLNNPIHQNQNINTYRDGIMSSYMTTKFDYEYNNARPLSQGEINRIPEYQFLEQNIFEKAYAGYLKYKKSGKVKKDILIVVDYTKSDRHRRLYVFDMKNNKVLFNTWTQQGRGTDPLRTGYAQYFSNKSGSNMTSLGFMLTAETYYGMWGYSLRLDGLDPELNSKVRSRAVVMHGTGMLYASGIAMSRTAGLSEGCITLGLYESGKFYGLEDKPLNQIIIDQVKGGSLIYSYATDLD